MKPVIPRQLANHDIDEAIEHYLTESGEQSALCYIDALQRAYDHIARHPASGSTRYAADLNLPDLRFWPLTRYPYLVFYIEQPDHIDVWRVLHSQRDIPVWMAGTR